MNRQRNRRLPLPLLLCTLFLGSSLAGGCATAAVAVGALVLSDDFHDRAQAAIVPVEPILVYKSTLSTLSHMTGALIDRDDDLMAANTLIDYGSVTIQVREIAVGETEIRVRGEKALLYNAELSAMVLDRITNDLQALRRDSNAVPMAAMATRR